MNRRVLIFGDGFVVPVRNLAGFLAASGWDVHVFAFSEPDLPGIIHSHKLPVGRGFGLLRLRSEVRRIVRKWRPDVLHSFYLTSYGFGVSGLGEPAPPVLSSAMGSDVFGAPELWRPLSPARSWLVRKAIQGAGLLHSVAQHMTERLIELGAEPARIETFPRGVSLETFTNPPRPARRESGPVRILCNRKLEPVYDHATLIKASGMLKSSDTPFRLRIVGEGYLRNSLERLATALGLTREIRFEHGIPHERVPAILEDAELFVTASRSDGTSSCLLEAMASGCVPVAVDIPANRPWIRQGRNGFLFEAGNPASLAEAITEAIDESERWPEIRRRNRARIETDGSLETGHQKVLAMYDRLMRQK